MKKKITALFAVILLLAFTPPSFASVGVKVDNEQLGAATDLKFKGDATNQPVTISQGNLQFNLVLAGVDNTGTTSINSSTADISATGYALVYKDTPATLQRGNLSNGRPGQILTVLIAVDGGGNYDLYATTRTGWYLVSFDDARDRATFLYVDDTIGWIILSTVGTTNL